MVDKHLPAGGTGDNTAPEALEGIGGCPEFLSDCKAYRSLLCSKAVEITVYGELDGGVVHTYSGITEDDGHTLLDGEALTFGNYKMPVHEDGSSALPDSGDIAGKGI